MEFSLRKSIRVWRKRFGSQCRFLFCPGVPCTTRSTELTASVGRSDISRGLDESLEMTSKSSPRHGYMLAAQWIIAWVSDRVTGGERVEEREREREEEREREREEER